MSTEEKLNMPYDLTIVMPVYNEEECIVETLTAWISELESLKMRFKILVLNDGSTDSTAERLKIYEDKEHIEIINKENSGHGPSILAGYRKAASIADWVFQCDSDNEMEAIHFTKLWEKKDEYDALFGGRQERDQDTGRKFISAISRITTKIFVGRGVRDVNTPYRLIKGSLLKNIVALIPDNTFAPNLLISGILGWQDARLLEISVPHTNRKTGTVSLVKWRLIKSVVKSYWQTITYAPGIKAKLKKLKA